MVLGSVWSQFEIFMLTWRSSKHNQFSACLTYTCHHFLAEDPEERNNLAESDPDRVAAMIAKLDAGKATERIPDLSLQIPVAAGDAKNFGGIWTPGWC